MPQVCGSAAVPTPVSRLPLDGRNLQPAFYLVDLHNPRKLLGPALTPSSAVTLQNSLAGTGMGRQAQVPCITVPWKQCQENHICREVPQEKWEGRPGVALIFLSPWFSFACSRAHMWLAGPSCCSHWLSLRGPVATLRSSLILRALLSFCPWCYFRHR